jgi:hypothetical protein
MNDAHGSAGIPDSLAKPDDIPMDRILSHIQIFPLILFMTIVFVDGCHREDEKESMDWTRDEGEEVWVRDTIYIMESEFWRQSEGLSVLRDDSRVRFKRHPFLTH